MKSLCCLLLMAVVMTQAKTVRKYEISHLREYSSSGDAADDSDLHAETVISFDTAPKIEIAIGNSITYKLTNVSYDVGELASDNGEKYLEYRMVGEEGDTCAILIGLDRDWMAYVRNGTALLFTHAVQDSEKMSKTPHSIEWGNLPKIGADSMYSPFICNKRFNSDSSRYGKFVYSKLIESENNRNEGALGFVSRSGDTQLVLIAHEWVFLHEPKVLMTPSGTEYHLFSHGDGGNALPFCNTYVVAINGDSASNLNIDSTWFMFAMESDTNIRLDPSDSEKILIWCPVTNSVGSEAGVLYHVGVNGAYEQNVRRRVVEQRKITINGFLEMALHATNYNKTVVSGSNEVEIHDEGACQLDGLLKRTNYVGHAPVTMILLESVNDDGTIFRKCLSAHWRKGSHPKKQKK